MTGGEVGVLVALAEVVEAGVEEVEEAEFHVTDFGGFGPPAGLG